MTKQWAVPTLHNEVRKKMRSTKENWIEERCDAMKKGMKAGNSKESYDTLMILPKPNSREQLSAIIMIVSWSQTRMESWGGGQDSAVTCRVSSHLWTRSTPTAPYYKPTGLPLNVRTVRRYWRGSRIGSENRQFAGNGWHTLCIDK